LKKKSGDDPGGEQVGGNQMGGNQEAAEKEWEQVGWEQVGGKNVGRKQVGEEQVFPNHLQIHVDRRVFPARLFVRSIGVDEPKQTLFLSIFKTKSFFGHFPRIKKVFEMVIRLSIFFNRAIHYASK
jgi:hypothetical protein